ncbi:MAG: hypothetical protein MRY21_06590 [Simkaniaceae bacterium]|nr:hypothetical protein [Simkaniaceae bacterium]
MLENLFGGKNIEKVFFYLMNNKQCYATALSRQFNQALSPFQKALDRLELGGVLVSFLEGRTRIYRFNPRYPFLSELLELIKRAYAFLPDEQKENFYEPKVRKRPRRRGKPL